MHQRVKDGAALLAREFSMTRDEFRRAMPEGAEIFDAMQTHNLLIRKGDRYALNETGRRAAEDGTS